MYELCFDGCFIIFDIQLFNIIPKRERLESKNKGDFILPWIFSSIWHTDTFLSFCKQQLIRKSNYTKNHALDIKKVNFMENFSNINSLEYCILSWYLYLDDLKKRRKRKLFDRLLSKNIIQAYVMQKNFEDLLQCKDATDKTEEIGFLLLKAGKISLKTPDKYGMSYAYDIDKMIDKLRNIAETANKINR